MPMVRVSNGGTTSVTVDSSVTIAAYSNIIQNCQIGKIYLVTSGCVGVSASQAITSGGTTLFSHTTKIGSNTNGFAIVFIATSSSVTMAYDRDAFTYSVALIE